MSSVDKKVVENKIEDEIYLNKIPYFLIAIFSFVFISLAFILNFPLEEKVQGAITKALKSNKSCQVSYSEMDFSLFLLPSFNLKDVSLPGRCFGSSSAGGLNFSNVDIDIVRPTVLPPGVLIETKIKDKITNLNVFASMGITSASIRVEKSIVEGNLIAKAGNLPLKLKGTLSVDALLDTDYKIPTAGSFHITSKDLTLPPQMIMILQLKSLSLAPLVLKGNLKDGIVRLLRFQVGNAQSKIEAIFTNGVITLNKKNPRLHKADLEGKIRFGEDFLTEYPILNAFLGKAKKDEKGFYTVELKGLLSQLRPKLL
ncbi:MAG: hypothetical protein ACJAT2_002674 [Bacteriovoracaceae bacterium]|jgi:hypothetical protein